MRLILTTSVLACSLLVAGAAWAQETSDGPLATAGSKAGGAPSEAAPAQVVQTPSAAKAQPQPSNDDLMAAAETGRRAPLLGEYHGSVGAVVGTGGLRGAYGHINAQPNEHVTVDLRFSTLHGQGYAYPGAYGPGLYVDPMARPPLYPHGSDGWSTEVLGPGDEPPGQTAGGH